MVEEQEQLSIDAAKSTLLGVVETFGQPIDPSQDLGALRETDLNRAGPALKTLVESITGVHVKDRDVFLSAEKITPEGTLILDNFLGAEMRVELFRNGKPTRNLIVPFSGADPGDSWTYYDQESGIAVYDGRLQATRLSLEKYQILREGLSWAATTILNWNKL